MKTESSCGAILYKKEDGVIKYLIIKDRNDNYSFPYDYMKKEGKEILKTMYAEVKDKDYHSTLEVLEDRDDDIKVYGGKTGFTLEAGMNIMTLYEADNRSYLLILANAEGSPYVGARSNIDDVNNVMNFLYN